MALFQSHQGAALANAFPPGSVSPLAAGRDGTQMVLMEALASRDFRSMAAALTSATNREVHAAMLNACAKGNAEAVELLLERAPDISLTQGCIIAARSGHAPILRLCLAKNAEKPGGMGGKARAQALNTSLVQAAARGHSGIVHELVHRTKPPPEPDTVKRAMLSAASRNHGAVLQVLLPVLTRAGGSGGGGGGAPPTQLSAEAEDTLKAALVAACSAGHARGAALLIAGMPGRLMDQPLAVCASKGHVDLVRTILHMHNGSIDVGGGGHGGYSTARENGGNFTTTGITPAAVEHARNIAKSKAQKRIVELLSDFLCRHFPDFYMQQQQQQQQQQGSGEDYGAGGGTGTGVWGGGGGGGGGGVSRGRLVAGPHGAAPPPGGGAGFGFGMLLQQQQQQPGGAAMGAAGGGVGGGPRPPQGLPAIST